MIAPVADLFDVVGRQRACRQFRPDPVEDRLLERCLEAATFAPSAENRQPWVFVVVRDPGLRALIGDLTRRAWEGGGRRHSETRLGAQLLTDVDRGAEGGVAAAPILVVVCGDTRLGLEVTLPASVFPAIQNLLLAATALGLGSALTTLPVAFGSELRTMLALPDPVHPLAVVPLGWPVRALGPPRRQPVAEKAHRDRYGSGW
jgi:nitroreductase